ncbi:reverse transcriptase domain-containing protein [Clavibacter michiganensis]|uniref:reverse transcriptase domain-containing protein n=1 Tax=Clavibacter michiganensis TaxID=28447 RepID=UPI0026DD6528|nr:reverse transcriptase domain-containing protein [Clavibacter michiganensis]MDO4045066.1 reverse transcriptase domain-containing protein [Clavibacter michiganensis]MDO4052157.1 reverse transcriptase domain-containing protein [Clavibacter michiganensis]MDO4057502.1 reverse transcriptase domain-containing protein [Clavibacter michiganensis]MDO4069356.1 reverse transcriptase domain-containing protein [Clavibacter michiganensis]
MGDGSVTKRRLWHRHVTNKALEDSWKRIQDSGGAGRDGETPKHFARHIDESIKRLNRELRHDSHTFIAYLQLLKSKGAGKNPRIISIPSTIDRVALRAMAVYLRAVHPEQASTKLPQTLVSEVITSLESNSWSYFVKLDIQNFYPSIDHAFLRAELTRHIKDKRVVDTYMKAVKTPTTSRGAARPTHVVDRGVPQGLAISNALAELTMELVDRYLRSSPDFIAFRFVDDILILTHESTAGQITAEVRRIAGLAGLTVHDEESGKGKHAKGPLSDGFDFLGYQFEWPRITVRQGSVVKIESRITRAFTAYKYALERNPESEEYLRRAKERLKWHLNLVITGFTLDGQRIGWLAYFSQIRNQQLLKHLDGIVIRKARRFGVADLEFKTFVRSYRAVASRRVSTYIPNFDTISQEEMVCVMTDVFGMTDVARLSEEVLRARFIRKIKRISKDLEADVPSYT